VQREEQRRVPVVRREVHLAQVRRAVHGHLDELGLVAQRVAPVRAHRRPPHGPRPARRRVRVSERSRESWPSCRSTSAAREGSSERKRGRERIEGGCLLWGGRLVVVGVGALAVGSGGGVGGGGG
jgi:hypothetical protein